MTDIARDPGTGKAPGEARRDDGTIEVAIQAERVKLGLIEMMDFADACIPVQVT